MIKEGIDEKMLNELLKRLLKTQKAVLTAKEAANYLDLSLSHLYKLTSGRKIPYYCPSGKRLYFKRVELEEWMTQNRQVTDSELESEASHYVGQKMYNYETK